MDPCALLPCPASGWPAAATELAPAATTPAAAGPQQLSEADGLVSADDFAAAMQLVGPSIVRGAAVEVAPVSWCDVGGYDELKQRLQQAVEWPLQHAGQMAAAAAAAAAASVVLSAAWQAAGGSDVAL